MRLFGFLFVLARFSHWFRRYVSVARFNKTNKKKSSQCSRSSLPLYEMRMRIFNIGRLKPVLRNDKCLIEKPLQLIKIFDLTSFISLK